MKPYFFCRGSVRGTCAHKHRKFETARKCCARDQKNCKAASRDYYSDRKIFVVDAFGNAGPARSNYEYDYDDNGEYER